MSSSTTPSKVSPTKLALPTEPSVLSQLPTDHIMLFYGPPGVGKTTFVNQLGQRVLFLSTDRGTRSIKSLRIEVPTVDKLEAAIDALEAAKSLPYDIICLDHIDDVCHMLADAVCEALGVDALSDAGYGKGWKLFADGLHNVVARLKALNTGLVFICHETIKTIKAQGLETDRTMPDIVKSAWKLLIPLVDLVGYCGFTPVKNAEGKREEIRTLTTTPREDLYAKDRTLRVRPNGIEKLDGSKFISTFKKV